MAPRWPRALRFAEGDRLRFTLDLAPALRAMVAEAGANAAFWLAVADDAVLHLERLSDDAFVLRLEGEPASVRLEATPSADGAFELALSMQRGPETSESTVGGVAIMLGGSRDAIVARRGDGGTVLLVRLRYDRDGPGAGVALAVFTAPFADRLSRAARALLPAELRVARLTPCDAEAGSTG